jgi:hypothetical protein
MAFKDTLDFEELPIFYNLNMAVGDNAPNMKEDVMLVQFFLQEVYKGRTSFDPPEVPPQGVMKVDGICGPITKNWLLKFQLDIRNRGYSIYADKRADKVKGRVSSISKTTYTVIYLNAGVKKVRPDFENLESAPDVPNELRPAFRMGG